MVFRICNDMIKNPVSIPQAIHGERAVYSADSIGIAAPVYGHELPQMVKDFLKKTKAVS